MPDHMTRPMPDDMPDRIHEPMPHHVPDRIPDRVSDQVPDQVTDGPEGVSGAGVVAEEIVASKAAPDLVCWLLAAVPPNRRGGVNVARIAEVLGVNRSTVYRWLKTAAEREFEPDARRLLARYAVLRGHGGYLWPVIDEAIAARHAAYLEEALAGVANVTANPDAYRTWKSASTPAEVFTYHHPPAKVYGVAYATSETNRRRALHGGAIIIESARVPSVLHAKAVKYATLTLAGNERCIAPRELMGNGRTEVWRQRLGQIDLTPLP